MRFCVSPFLVAATLLVSSGEVRAQTKDDVKLTKIKTADVEKAIAAHKGKVVLLDVWAEF